MCRSMPDNNINKIMLHKTVDKSDTQSQSTKVTQSTKAASFMSTSKRQMYRNKASQNTNKVQMEICNMIEFVPQFTTFVISDHVIFLESGQSFVNLTDNHYTIISDRSKPFMICRNTQPNSEVLSWNAKKPGTYTYLESVSRFANLQYPCMLHFNVSKYNPNEFQPLQTKNVYISYDPNYQLLFFITMENSKKGIVASYVPGEGQKNQYQILFINLIKQNKSKNPKHKSMLKQRSFSLYKDEQSDMNNQKAEEKQILYAPVDSIRQKISLTKDQKIIKMINSEFGDSILVATNKNIYQLEFEPRMIMMKGMDFSQKISKFLKQKSFDDEIIDVCYVIDGLKILFLTAKGIIGLVEAENIQYACLMSKILAKGNKKQQEHQVKKIFALVGKIAIQTEKGVVFLFQFGENQLIFEKKIELPVHNNDTLSYLVNILERHEQLILQIVRKQNNRSILQVKSKSLLSITNDYSQLYSSALCEQKMRAIAPLKIVNSKSNSLVCSLRENTVTFYHFNEDFSSEKLPVQQIFSKTFFERPLYVSINPYGSNIIILFRQFVKFYKFQYKQLGHYYTFNMRNVCYAGFTESGQYIMIAVDDLLYFINPFNFETERVMEAYGDIKSVRYFDSVMYILLKNKVNKNTSEVLNMQIYVQQHNEYKKVDELKVEPTEALLTDRNIFIIANNKQIQIFHRKDQQYGDQGRTLKRKRSYEVGFEQIYTKKIKLSQASEYPTCITLCEEFGIILIGTNHGKIYEYIWPFNAEEDLEYFYMFHCSNSEIVKIQIGTSFEKVYIYCRNSNIMKTNIVQYVEGEEMPNIYVINSKTLYGKQQLKYQFANKEYLYPKLTTYITEDMRQAKETIQELNFILEKTNDDVEEELNKISDKYKNQFKSIDKQKKDDVNLIQQQKTSLQNQTNFEHASLLEQLKRAQKQYKQVVQKQKDDYTKKLLDLYKQAARLRGIQAQLQKEQNQEKDTYLIQNLREVNRYKEQSQKVDRQYSQKFKDVEQNNKIFMLSEKQEAKQHIDSQLEQYKAAVRNNIEEELAFQEQRKENLLGSNGYHFKQIINYKQRRDQFDALLMETNMQIQQLHVDQKEYIQKQKYLMEELGKKQKIIQEKEKELVKLVKSAQIMKKLKQTHQFQLRQYEEQFKPILNKMSEIDEYVRKMNGQILKQYISKVQRERQIIQNKQKYKKLRNNKQRCVRKKLNSESNLERLLAQLDGLLNDPFAPNLRNSLIYLTEGQKYEIVQQQIQHKVENDRLMRKKQFIRKQIEQRQKRQQMMMKNKNQIMRHYTQNTVLVRQFNELTQLKKELQAQQQQLTFKLIAAKTLNAETPRKKSASVTNLKRTSDKKLTPFQRHQDQYIEMFKKGQTSETKVSRSGHSMSLLKSLIKDVESSDSRYQKMEIVRNRVRSFVNPEIRIKKTLVAQKLFDRKNAQSQIQ